MSRLSATLPAAGKNESTKPRRRRIRRSVVGVLVALSCLLVLLSTTEVWAHRTLLNTPAFVGTVAPVFQDPAVASAVATRATDELFTELNRPGPAAGCAASQGQCRGRPGHQCHQGLRRR